MAITKPVKKTVQSLDTFINAAPDGVEAKAAKGVMRGHKQQISLTIQPALLEKIDAMAARLGQSRAAVINLAIYKLIESDV